jgi:hypothetical protein
VASRAGVRLNGMRANCSPHAQMAMHAAVEGHNEGLFVLCDLAEAPKMRQNDYVPHVFLSYVREDSAAVDRLAAELTSNGIEIWLDRLSIKPGERWDLAIREAVRSGDFFIACFSENSMKKARSGMNQELILAVDELMLRPLNRTWFIPVLLSPCEVPQYSLGGTNTLRSIQYVSLFEHWATGVRSLLTVIRPDPAKARSVSYSWEDIVDYFKLHKSEDERFDDIIRALAAKTSGAKSVVQGPAWWESRYGHGAATLATVEMIEASGTVTFLEECLMRDTDNLHRAWIYQVLGRIGDSKTLNLVLDGYIRWKGNGLDIVENANREGEDLSRLFPYRELHALTYYGSTAAKELERVLQSQPLTNQVRAGAALAVLKPENSGAYEPYIASALQEGFKIYKQGFAHEALFALRCFDSVQTHECRKFVVQAAKSNVESIRVLAAKVAFNNRQRIDAVKASGKYNYDHTINIWDEVYYYYHP